MESDFWLEHGHDHSIVIFKWTSGITNSYTIKTHTHTHSKIIIEEEAKEKEKKHGAEKWPVSMHSGKEKETNKL